VPLYDYDCANCGRRFEVIHGVHADPPTSCPLCGGGPVKKAIQAPAVHFKGSGWAKKERRTTVAPGKAASGDADTGGDAAPAAAAPSASPDPALPGAAVARRSFFAQPDPLKWTAGAWIAFLTGPPPHSGQLAGGSA